MSTLTPTLMGNFCKESGSADSLPLPPPRRARFSTMGSSSSLGKPSNRNSVESNLSAKKASRGKVFVDAEQMKEKIRAAAAKPTYHVANFYHTTGIWQRMARHQMFENVTLAIIAVNALWIAIDTDLNTADVLLEAHPVFQVMEHLFCIYFTFEWLVRFKSFTRKCDGLKDGWFIFDSALVFMGVSETWVMTAVLLVAGGPRGAGLGNASMLRMARLLRLTRMARMARLFKAMPELLILIKAMVASIRSCFFVFLLLAMMMYVFGIAFKQLTAGTPVGDTYFKNVIVSMHTLWLEGTLLDSTGKVVQALSEESLAYVVIFYIFVLLSALTVMNMLIGVLCTVVSALAASEKESLAVHFVKSKLQDLMDASGFDQDRDGMISKEEFSSLLEFPEACKALTDIGVDIYTLIDNIDFIFAADNDGFGEEEDKNLSFEDFMGLMLDLRGSNTATVKDIVELRKFISQSNRRVQSELRASEHRIVSRSTDMVKDLHAPGGELRPQPDVPCPGRGLRSESDMSCPVDSVESSPERPAFLRSTQAEQDQLRRQNDLILSIQEKLQHMLKEAVLPEMHKLIRGDLLSKDVGRYDRPELKKSASEVTLRESASPHGCAPEGMPEQSAQLGGCQEDKVVGSSTASPDSLPGQMVNQSKEGLAALPGDRAADDVGRIVAPAGPQPHGKHLRRHVCFEVSRIDDFASVAAQPDSSSTADSLLS